MIARLQEDYSVKRLCAVLDCPRSSYYYQSRPGEQDELLAEIEAVLMRWPFYGYRRVLQELHRRGWAEVGERVVRRLLRQLEHSCAVGRVKVSTTDSSHPHWRYPNRIKGWKATYPDQVWVADITFIRFGRRFIYLAVILDAFTRAVRGWALSGSLDQQLTLDALEMALENGVPFIFHSDQGSPYTTGQHTQRLAELGVKISMSDTGQPTQNGLVERFIRTLKEEHVDYAEYADFVDAYRQLKQWLEVEYMTERIHSALSYLTPAAFEVMALAELYPPLISP